MKSTIYLSLAIVSLLWSSCSKKKDAPYDPSGALAAVVKSVTHSSTGVSETYTYDSQGRIQQIQSSVGNKTSFAYDTASITETKYDDGGNIVSVTNIVLDTLGLASESITKDAGGSILSYHTYTYDWQKEKTEEDGYTASHDVNGKSEWVWGGGNMFEYSIYDSAVTHKAYDSYNWYYDPNVTSIGNKNTGQTFWGADSKYLIRKVVGATWGGGNTIFTFEYSFDSKQRITETRTYDHNGTLKNTDTYSYY